MKLNNRKFWFAVIPIAAGALILSSLWWISSSRSSAPKPAASVSTSASVPENAAHERASLEEQLKRNPDHPPILMRLAEMEREAGKPAGAVPYLKKILDKDPAQEEARLELGRALYDSGDMDGAVRETKKLVTDHPKNVDGLYNLGAIYANQQMFDLARQYWSQAVAAAPQSESGRKAQDGLLKLGIANLSKKQ